MAQTLGAGHFDIQLNVSPPVETDRAVVLGKFGGFGLPIVGHTWRNVSPPEKSENTLMARDIPY